MKSEFGLGGSLAFGSGGGLASTNHALGSSLLLQVAVQLCAAARAVPAPTIAAIAPASMPRR